MKIRALSMLAFWLAFFFPAATSASADGGGDADAGDGDADADVDTGEDTVEETDESADEDAEDADADGDADEPPAPRASGGARARAVNNDASEALRLAREATERVAALSNPGRPDPTWQAEEERLKDASLTDLERWQIQSNRALRQSQAESRQALFQAQDMADRTAYQAKSMSSQLHSKFSDKVEKELSEARAKGANPPREMVLALVIGRETLAGNFKPKQAAGKSATGKVNRGKSPGARSDTPARGGTTDQQKRAARLANINI